MWPFKPRSTPDSERARGRIAAQEFLASNPSDKKISDNYGYACVDEDQPITDGPYFAQGFKEVLKPLMSRVYKTTQDVRYKRDEL